jgi:hypothetical protein
MNGVDYLLIVGAFIALLFAGDLALGLFLDDDGNRR